MKRLSDLGSNYIIRKKNIVKILETADKLDISKDEKEDFKNRYIGVIKRICCQSSDENKSIYFEYLMLYEEEFEEFEQGRTFDPDKQLFYFLKKEKAFAEEAFLENTCVLNDGIRELARDYKNVYKIQIDIFNILCYNKYTYSGTSERTIIILKLLKPFRLTIPV